MGCPVADRHRHGIVVEELARVGKVFVGGRDDAAVPVQAWLTGSAVF